MQIQVVTDNHIEGSDRLSGYVQSVLAKALARFGNRVTWVEAHLGDENSHKAGSADKWCAVHAKLGGLQTVNVNAHGDTLDQAIDYATDKLLTVLDRTLGKKGDLKKRPPTSGEPGL